MPPLLGLMVSYLLGSIPAAFLAGKLVRGIDLRQHGSGNLGATNVWRVLGWKVAVPVFAFDMLKGAAPVLLLPRVTATANPAYWAILYGLAAILGHVRPVFLLGRGGGKGIATATGVFFALAPLATAVATAVFVAVLLQSGYVALGSLVAALTLVIGVVWRNGIASPLFVVSAVVCAFVFWTHRANIARLRRGEEHRFGRGKAR